VLLASPTLGELRIGENLRDVSGNRLERGRCQPGHVQKRAVDVVIGQRPTLRDKVVDARRPRQELDQLLGTFKDDFARPLPLEHLR
jgi:hypothetical protein